MGFFSQSTREASDLGGVSGRRAQGGPVRRGRARPGPALFGLGGVHGEGRLLRVARRAEFPSMYRMSKLSSYGILRCAVCLSTLPLKTTSPTARGRLRIAWRLACPCLLSAQQLTLDPGMGQRLLGSRLGSGLSNGLRSGLSGGLSSGPGSAAGSGLKVRRSVGRTMS